MATREQYKQYVESIAEASKLAQDELGRFWDSLDKSDPEKARDALIAYMPPLIEKYGGIAALAAAEYYENERNAAYGGEYSALVAEPVPTEQIEKAVRFAAGHMFGGEDGRESGEYTGLFDGAMR